MATQTIMCSPQRWHHPNHPARRSEATPHCYCNGASACRERLSMSGGDDRRVVDLAGWVAWLDAIVELIAGRFGRFEPGGRVLAWSAGRAGAQERLDVG
jgi:hypothetical protein